MTDKQPIDYARPEQNRSTKTRNATIVFCLFVLIVCVFAGLRFVSGAFLFAEQKLVRCKVGDAKISLIFDGSFDAALRLRIQRTGREQSEYVIDKSEYATLRLISYNGRGLVANENFIFAAYDLANDQIIHYHDLPFTIWEGQGEVLDSYRWFNRPARMRPGFPIRRAGDN